MTKKVVGCGASPEYHVLLQTKEPYILIVEGKYLEHPKSKKGTRSRMKIFRVGLNKDLPLKTIELILRDALELYQNGTIAIKLFDFKLLQDVLRQCEK